MSRVRLAVAASSLLTLVSASGCGLILGLSDFKEGPEGTGGAGGGAQGACDPGKTAACYTGSQSTEGHGTCKAGEKTCLADGSRFGDCVGEILPATKDDCVKHLDTTCDGQLTCECTPAAVEPCYDGPMGTDQHAPCKGGMRTCDANGTGFGACVGETKPAPAEDCTTPADDNCDGVVNESCACTPNAMESCYSGPGGTVGVGVCVAGMRTCDAQGTAWSACIGEVVPSAEKCDVLGDENCDGARCSEAFVGALFDGTNSDMSTHVYSTLVDYLGNTYLTATLEGATNLGNVVLDGSASTFLLKLDPAGVPLWATQFGPSVGKVLVTLTGVGPQTSITLAGDFSGTTKVGTKSLTSAGATDIFVAQFEPTGVFDSASSFGGAGDEDLTALAMSGGWPLLGGARAGGTLTVGNTTLGPTAGVDAFLLLASGGSPGLWGFGDKPGAPAGNQTISGLAVDAGGNVIIGLGFDQSAQIGATSYLSIGSTDFAIAKLAAGTLAPVWSSAFGSPANDALIGVHLDASGAVFVAGSSAGIMDLGGGNLGGAGASGAFAAKFSAVGVHQWSKSFAGSSADIETMAVDSSGDLVIAGTVYVDVDLGGGDLVSDGSDVFLAKLTGAGVHQWSKILGGSGVQTGDKLAIAPTAKKNISLALYNQGTVKLESGSLTSNMSFYDSLVVGIFSP